MHRWAAWLLPLVVARLFVPMGFMLAASGDGFGIALCPAYAPVPTLDASTTARHHGATHHSDGTPHSDDPGNASLACPFALAGSHAACPATETIGELPRLEDAAPDYRRHPDWISPAVLIDRIRGPPLA